MSDQPTDRDAAVVRWIAAYLDVELTPWQGEFLQTMMRAHRLGQTPVGAKAPNEEGPPWCGAGHPSGANIFCSLKPGHTDFHRSTGSRHVWAETIKPSPYGLCGEVYPGDVGITCKRARGHADVHEAGQPGTGGYRRWTDTS